MSSEAQARGAGRTEKRACGYPGHLRVRYASVPEKQSLAGLFAESDHAGWVAEALAAAGTMALLVERFAEGAWAPLGCTVSDAGGETALALYPGERRRGLAHEVLRAAVRVLREEPLNRLTARLGPDHEGLAGIFAGAGFTPAGTCLFRGRPSMRYVRNLRGDCTPYNVWI